MNKITSEWIISGLKKYSGQIYNYFPETRILPLLDLESRLSKSQKNSQTELNLAKQQSGQ